MSGRLILVTGASSGIGRAVALACVAAGDTVLALGRDRARLDKAREEAAQPQRWLPVCHDLVADLPGLADWTRELIRAHGRLHGFVHCAGAALMDSVRLFDLEQSRRLFDLNFNVPLLMARAVADRRCHEKGGSLVFLASAAGAFPEKGHLLYGATKAALMAAAKSLSCELAPALRVNCLCPGIVDTPMQAAAEAFMGEGYREKELAGYPFGFGQPQDVAEMAVFLLSDKSRWITGQNFVLAGGRY